MRTGANSDLLAASIERTLSPNDEMFGGDEEHCFGAGRSALHAIRLALAAAQADSPRRILDLPCGHGRVLRWLRAAWPDAEFTACDIARDGVDFCERTFGARPVSSALDPEDVPIPPRSFDLIWVGSLLTHVDRRRWSSFLDRFHSWLVPRGLLVFTTHGRYVAYRMEQGIDYGLQPGQRAELLAAFARDGFAYQDYPGSHGYGIALATPAFVTRLLLGGPDARLVAYGERSWDDHQDVVACQRIT